MNALIAARRAARRHMLVWRTRHDDEMPWREAMNIALAEVDAP